MTPEGKVSKEIADYLNKQRILNGRRQATTVKNGEADRWLLYKGIYVNIEIKRPGGGITTLLQKNKLKALRENGGVGLVVDCVEAVMKVLDDIDILVWNELNNLKYDRLKEINTLFNDSRSNS
jgi:hypothetical protein